MHRKQAAALALLATIAYYLALAQIADAQQGVVLRYKFSAGQTIRYGGEHVMRIEATAGDSTQTAKTQTKFLRQWTVQQVDADGTATLVMSIERVQVDASMPDGNRIAFDTDKETDTPASGMVKRPLVQVRLRPNGQVAELKEAAGGGWSQFISGVKLLFCPFPTVPITAGTAWQRELEVRLPGSASAKVKLRQTFRLEQLDGSSAVVSVNTEPAEQVDPPLMAQVAQLLGNGKFLFDVQNGLLKSQNTSVQQVVQGYAGSDSQMQVVGQFSESLLDPAAPTARSADASQN